MWNVFFRLKLWSNGGLKLAQESSRPGVYIVCPAGPNWAATGSQGIRGSIIVIATVKFTHFF